MNLESPDRFPTPEPDEEPEMIAVKFIFRETVRHEVELAIPADADPCDYFDEAWENVDRSEGEFDDITIDEEFEYL